MHNRTKYPLTGSHLAVPCLSCHKRIATASNIETIQFRYESTRCNKCHENPHRREVDKYIAKGECEYCHVEVNWRVIRFDHDQTEFRLTGGHSKVKCGPCHWSGDPDSDKSVLRLSGVSRSCESCHRDIHNNQFSETQNMIADSGVRASCERCHTPDRWYPDNFDHDRSSRFKLEGAHRKTECRACHKKVARNNESIVLYKPLGTACKSCHASGDLKEDGK